MSRHRNVRGMNYEDEYDGYDDFSYGHSVEDDYCVSPGTAAQFTFNRDSQPSLATYITEEDIPEEAEPNDSDDEASNDPLCDSTNYKRPQLSDIDEARLNSCLEGIRNITGDTTPDHVLIDTIIHNDFDLERSLDCILRLQDAPKPQREPRNRRRMKEDECKFQFDFGLNKQNSFNTLESTHNLNSKDINVSVTTLHDKRAASHVPNVSLSFKFESPLRTVGSLPTKKAASSLSALAQSHQRAVGGRSLLGLQNSSDSPQNSPNSVGPPARMGSIHHSTISQTGKKTTSSLTALAQCHQQTTKSGNVCGLQTSGHNPPNLLSSPTARSTFSTSLTSLAQLHSKTQKPSSMGSGSPSLVSLAKGHMEKHVGLSSVQKQTDSSSDRLSNTNVPVEQRSALADLNKQLGESKISNPPRIPRESLAEVTCQFPITNNSRLRNKEDSTKTLIDLTKLKALSMSPGGQLETKPKTTLKTGLCVTVLPHDVDNESLVSVNNEKQQTHLFDLAVNSISVERFAGQPSTLADVLVCNQWSRRESKNRKVRYKRFSFACQSVRDVGLDSVYQAVVPFDFTTPSPDDVNRERQKAAFTRDGNRDSATKPVEAQIVLGDPPQHHQFKTPPAKTVLAPVITTVQPPTPQKTFVNDENKVCGFKTSSQDGTQQLAPPSGQDEAESSDDSRPSTPKRDYKRNLWPSEGSGSRPSTPQSRPSTPQSGGEDSGVVNRSAKKREKFNVQHVYEKRKEEKGKELINLVIIGHVDAGKSTLMGHVLYQIGCVNKRTMHKYEQESKKLGKASFAYAWVLDETEEERARGVTMDVAQTRFETEHRVVNLLDAPGHKDFIPNMITGAAEADVAILVVNATRGEFETGFDAGGQTREHALLIRSLGVSQLAVAINKMDTVEWSEERFKDVVKKLGQFLKQAGFKDTDVDYVPCSGLSGENLTKPSTLPQLASWYSGLTLLSCIDKFKAPERSIDKPLRMVVQDVFKGMGTGFSVSGRIEAGSVQQGDKVIVMPSGEQATVKNLLIEEEMVQCAFAGDQVVMTMTNIDVSKVNMGSIVCDPASPIKCTNRFRARVVLFNVEVPITKGFPVVFHYQSLNEPAYIKRLISQLNKSSGEVVRNKPRCLPKNSNAVIELEVGRSICIELYKDYKDLGRFMLRSSGVTIAAGLVTEILESKVSKTES